MRPMHAARSSAVCGWVQRRKSLIPNGSSPKSTIEAHLRVLSKVFLVNQLGAINRPGLAALRRAASPKLFILYEQFPSSQLRQYLERPSYNAGLILLACRTGRIDHAYRRI